MNPLTKLYEKNKVLYTLLLMFIIIFGLSFLYQEKTFLTIQLFLKTLFRILPILGLILILMTFLGLILNNKIIKKTMGNKSGVFSMIIFAIAGILSSGPIYVWFPLLKDLKEKGLRNGLIAIFLYNRAIKLPLLPLIISYFGLKFTIILTITMLFASFLQGFIVDLLVKE